VVRDRDTVARYSGDQFALLLPGSDRRAAELVACRIHDVLASPVSAGDERVFADVVIGIAVTDAAGTRQPGHTARDLLRQANEDMYRTKTRASAAVVHEAPSPDRLRLETDLHGAVSRGEVLVHYQPQVDVPSGRVVGVEALARWTHPILGPVPPDAFIPLAEASGLIGEIGEHVLRAACRTLAGWRAEGLDLEVAVNVSAIQLADPDFNRLVESVLAEEGLPPHLLTLEVTESQVLSDVAISHGHLGRLRDIGVGISVDDFGTGYSSLVQLQRLPVTELKVDRAFTSQLSDRSSSPVVAGIVGLGHGLGLRVVAEGVETPAQLELLRELGCERAQGWLTGRPVPPEELSVLLSARAAVAVIASGPLRAAGGCP
jgi:EAL domain-containing protein (putative c-di-GMP-specific phosphodiesterase class I)